MVGAYERLVRPRAFHLRKPRDVFIARLQVTDNTRADVDYATRRYQGLSVAAQTFLIAK